MRIYKGTLTVIEDKAPLCFTYPKVTGGYSSASRTGSELAEYHEGIEDIPHDYLTANSHEPEGTRLKFALHDDRYGDKWTIQVSMDDANLAVSSGSYVYQSTSKSGLHLDLLDPRSYYSKSSLSTGSCEVVIRSDTSFFSTYSKTTVAGHTWSYIILGDTPTRFRLDID
ncbi:hypothetical protein [Burkholderia stagnalis]|uniref:hypothetical protein n=1 Tax=Burkholderia stagnalis TaxID=1503054 RepID=UPI0012D9BB54|nr:hypothetical protein [Burkholderia stagnalis]